MFDEEDSLSRVAEPSDADTPGQDIAVPVIHSKVAEPLDASSSEEEDAAIPTSGAQRVTRCTLVDETKPLVVGDWLSNKDIIVWLNHNLYHSKLGVPWAWATTVTYIVSCLNIMKKYKGC